MHALTTDLTPEQAVGRLGVEPTSVGRSMIRPEVARLAVIVCAVGMGGVRWGLIGAAIGTTCGIASLAAWVDARESRLPDRLLALAAMPPLVVVIVSLVRADPRTAAQILLGAAVFAIPLLMLHALSPDSLGFGDVKLGVVLGAVLGAVDPRLGLVALCLASGVTVVVAVTRRRRVLPFGPGLVLGTTCTLVLAGLIGLETVPW